MWLGWVIAGILGLGGLILWMRQSGGLWREAAESQAGLINGQQRKIDELQTELAGKWAAEAQKDVRDAAKVSTVDDAVSFVRDALVRARS